MANSDLPQEILIDIFSRLPAKSVGKCRCLAKTWRTDLSTPQFIKSHLLHKPYQQNLIFLDPSFSVHSAAAAEGAVSRRLHLQHNFVEIVGSCDGLVLFVVDGDRKVLVNPITLHSTEITDSPLALDKDERFNTCGLGYDEISDDYKIVELSYWDTDVFWEDTFVDVYSVRNCVWKRVDNSPYHHPIDHLSFGAFVDGAIHWIALCLEEEGFPYVIAAFDLADEEFDEMPLPNNADLARIGHYKLDVLGGCLCLVDMGVNRCDVCDVWVMKEYGVEKSWMKFSIGGEFHLAIDRIVSPLCFHRDDEEIIVVIDWESLASYNVKEQAFRGMAVVGVPRMFLGGGAFVESLVSPAPLE